MSLVERLWVVGCGLLARARGRSFFRFLARIQNSPPTSRSVLVVLTVLVAACAPLRVHESPATLAAQSAREAELAPRNHWNLTARLAVSSGNDGGSGELEWRQDGASYVFTVHAPVTGKTWKLSGDAQRAVLEGVDQQPLTGNDPERLLRDRLGWDVPLAELTAWVRGMRASGMPAQLQYDARNLPAVLDQAGWKVEYRDWFDDRSPALPRKVFASRGTARVRVAIEQWSFDE